MLSSKWNRNSLTSVQRVAGVPPLAQQEREAMDLLDSTLRRPRLMRSMRLQQGDAQILNNHFTVHPRADFEDHEDPARERLLFRLWLPPPD